LPLYPYRCTQCNHHFEKIQKFGAKPEKVCPKCGGGLERLLTAPGLKFKGSGWYVNDYAVKGSSSASASSGDAPSEKKAATEAKPETKAASGGESASSGATTAAPVATAGTAAN
jgi:putative FmdB family regulatory protein